MVVAVLLARTVWAAVWGRIRNQVLQKRKMTVRTHQLLRRKLARHVVIAKRALVQQGLAKEQL